MTGDERDAARYRWLRDESWLIEYRSPAVFDADDMGIPTGAPPLSGRELDEAIDAAMAPRYTLTDAGRAHLEGKS